MKKALIVDDDQYLVDFYHFLKEQSQDREVEITICMNGQEATELIKKETFDIVLLDLLMPEVDGFEVLELIDKKMIPRPEKIIILTNLDTPKEQERAKALGADGYYVKAEVSNDQLEDLIFR